MYLNWWLRIRRKLLRCEMYSEKQDWLRMSPKRNFEIKWQNKMICQIFHLQLFAARDRTRNWVPVKNKCVFRLGHGDINSFKKLIHVLRSDRRAVSCHRNRIRTHYLITWFKTFSVFTANDCQISSNIFMYTNHKVRMYSDFKPN